jgi:hypothetical protein
MGRGVGGRMGSELDKNVCYETRSLLQAPQVVIDLSVNPARHPDFALNMKPLVSLSGL